MWFRVKIDGDRVLVQFFDIEFELTDEKKEVLLNIFKELLLKRAIQKQVSTETKQEKTTTGD